MRKGCLIRIAQNIFNFKIFWFRRLQSTHLIYITLTMKTTNSADSECTSSTTAERVFASFFYDYVTVLMVQWDFKIQILTKLMWKPVFNWLNSGTYLILDLNSYRFWFWGKYNVQRSKIASRHVFVWIFESKFEEVM